MKGISFRFKQLNMKICTSIGNQRPASIREYYQQQKNDKQAEF